MVTVNNAGRRLVFGSTANKPKLKSLMRYMNFYFLYIRSVFLIITLQCPGCPKGGLDFSPGLFQFFSDLGAGVLYGTWWYTS